MGNGPLSEGHLAKILCILWAFSLLSVVSLAVQFNEVSFLEQMESYSESPVLHLYPVGAAYVLFCFMFHI